MCKGPEVEMSLKCLKKKKVRVACWDEEKGGRSRGAPRGRETNPVAPCIPLAVGL